jgi:uncharacterized protein (DUF58 family)
MAPAVRRREAAEQRAERLAGALPPLMVAADRVAATVAQGVHGRRRVGTGETFWQFRHYQHGDPINRIDWRQSAKSRPTFVRETEWEAAQSVWLWRDGSPSMRYRSKADLDAKSDHATILLLALAALLLRGGEHVGLLGADRLPRRGRAVMGRLAHALDAEPAESAPSLPAFEPLPRHAQIVLIGDFLSPLEDTDRLLRRFAAGRIRGHLVQVVDPAEEDLPFDGHVRFQGLEAEGVVALERVERSRSDYRSRFEAQRAGLAEIARQIGWTFAVHRTDRPLQAALLSLFMALAMPEN